MPCSPKLTWDAPPLLAGFSAAPFLAGGGLPAGARFLPVPPGFVGFLILNSFVHYYDGGLKILSAKNCSTAFAAPRSAVPPDAVINVPLKIRVLTPPISFAPA